MKHIPILFFAFSTLSVSLSTALAQGNLTPPGAPAPTMKTLAQIEPRTPISSLPYTIVDPGSYYLTTNLTGMTGTNGITIAASGVTLDLMGFELAGVTNSVDGIFVSGSRTNLDIQHGAVHDWGHYGVNAQTGLASRYHDLRMSGNGFSGIVVGSGSLLLNNTAYGNKIYGIRTQNGSTVSECCANGNLWGISSDSSITVVNCTANANTRDGIRAFKSTITSCTATFNGDTGIFTTEGSSIIGCTANGNSTNGIFASDDGPFLSASSTIRNCTASYNGGNGIVVGADCQVVGNTCANNGTPATGAGIQVIGSDNRIDSNNVTHNDRGITVVATGNLIIRNSVSSCTPNYDIGVNNHYGVIVNITAAAAAASGNSAASTVATTDPWANFAY